MTSSHRIPRPDPLETPDLDDYLNTTRDWETPWAGGRISVASLLRSAHKFLDFGPQDAHRSFLAAPKSLLLTDPDIDDSATDGEWEAVRLLGAGTFGTVGLWRKLTETRKVIDELAIKPVDVKQINEVHNSVVPSSEGLLKEAVFMYNLNRDVHSQNINHLRQYKYNRRAKLARFYMICCPYADLRDIQERYMVWDAYLPENFIWDVFSQLARGLQTMERRPDDENPYREPPGTDWTAAYLLHYDLKPANVMLDYPAKTSTAPEVGVMPCLRISDFGGSTYSSDTTPAVFHVSSSPGYRAPEQRAFALGRIQAYWRKPHNVWALGKTVFDITFQAEPNALGEDEDNAARTMQMGGPVQDGHFAPQDMRYYAEIFHKHYRDDQNQRFVYSPDLLRLIRDCLDPRPERRPTSQQILQRAQAGQHAYLNRLRAGATVDGTTASDGPRFVGQATRLYYVGNEINDMPMGKARFAIQRRRNLFVDQLRRADPDLPTLHPPASEYDDRRPDQVRQAVEQISEYVVKAGDQIVSLKDIQIIGGHDVQTAKINARPTAYAKVDVVHLLVEIVCRREEAGSKVGAGEVDDLENLDRASLIAELIKLDTAQGKLTETPGLMLKRKAFEVKYRGQGRDVVKKAIKERTKTVFARKGFSDSLRIAVLARLDQLQELQKGETQTEQDNPETEVERPRKEPSISKELLASQQQRIEELEEQLARINAERSAHRSTLEEIHATASTPPGDRPPSTGRSPPARPSPELQAPITQQPTRPPEPTQPTPPTPSTRQAKPQKKAGKRRLDPVLANLIPLETGKRTRNVPSSYYEPPTKRRKGGRS